MSKPIIKLSCFNGPGGSNPITPFEFVQTSEGGVGQASSYKVQFNINMDAVKGTIFVDADNDGMAIANLEGNFILTNGWAVIDPNGSYTEGNEKNPHKIDESVEIQRTIVSNKQIKFNVKRRTNGNDRGNITVTFFVTYKAAV